MYNASAQFHNAVFGNSPVERVLFKFADGTIFTNEDIHLTNGIKLIEAVNLEDELTIGSCSASSIEATIMNYSGLLNGFAFGECEVSLAARTETATINATSANVTAIFRYGDSSPVVFTGHSETPYLRVGGAGTTAQPSFAVHSIMINGTIVYCIGAAGEVWKAEWTDGQTWTAMSTSTWNDVATGTWDDIQGMLTEQTAETFNDFMVDKLTRWAAAKRGVSYNAGIAYEFYSDGRVEKYEHVKLGTFIIKTPQKRRINLISATAYDRMSLFDVSADDWWAGLVYPITLGEIFASLCLLVDVPQATTTFTNSTRSFTEAPVALEGVTAREVLRWIAEAACAFARMTRDGEVELAWFGEHAVAIPMTQYFSINAAEYSVMPVDKMQILGSQTDIGVIIGTGDNGYQILDNPFLYGETDTEIRTYGVPIYNKLSAFAAFSPISATAVCDWSIQAGDVISIVLNSDTYSLPVYCQTITWKGNARVSYESTGAERRPIMDAVNRRVFSQKRAMNEISATVDGLSVRVSDSETDIGTLEVFANSLTLAVTNGSTTSTIELMAGETQISSQNISFSGLVTFSNLTDGTTSISGSNIKTGTVSASRIDVANLYVENLSGASGTFNQISSIGTNPSIEFGSNVIITEDYLQIGNVELENNLITLGESTLTPSEITLSTSGVERVVIDASGLWLPGAQNSTRFYMNPPTGSGTAAHWVYRSGAGIYSLGIYSSSAKYKDNIRDLDIGAIDIINQLKPAWFRYKQDDFDIIGLIAEPTHEACADLVSLKDGEPDSIRYESVTTLLVSAIQDLDRRVRAIEHE